MIYRKNMRGDMSSSALALGLAEISAENAAVAEELARRAIDSGVNLIDTLAGSRSVFEAASRGIANAREEVMLALHIGAVFDETGEYEWTRDMTAIRRGFAWQLKQLGAERADIGVLHMIDDEDDVRVMRFEGMLDYAQKLKKRGMLGKLGFSTHYPDVAVRLLDLGVFDAAFVDFGPESPESVSVLERCRDEGVSVFAQGIFRGGDLLRNGMSPAKCLSRALDMPGVISAVADVADTDMLGAILAEI